MAKVKVKRKKTSPQRKKAQDYESPYAEYLLNAIKDNPTSETKVRSFCKNNSYSNLEISLELI
jgi:hypothetical protein